MKINSIKIWFWLKFWYVQLLCLLQFWFCSHAATAASVRLSPAWCYSSVIGYLTWNQAAALVTAYTKKRTNFGYFLGQVAYNVAIFKPTDSYCITVASLTSTTNIIPPAVAVHISCWYGRYRKWYDPLMQMAILHCSAILLTVRCNTIKRLCFVGCKFCGFRDFHFNRKIYSSQISGSRHATYRQSQNRENNFCEPHLTGQFAKYIAHEI